MCLIMRTQSTLYYRTTGKEDWGGVEENIIFEQRTQAALVKLFNSHCYSNRYKSWWKTRTWQLHRMRVICFRSYIYGWSSSLSLFASGTFYWFFSNAFEISWNEGESKTELKLQDRCWTKVSFLDCFHILISHCRVFFATVTLILKIVCCDYN